MTNRNDRLIEEVMESNKLENRDDSTPVKEMRLLGGVISQFNKGKAWTDVKEQKKIIARVKARHGFKI